MSIRKKILGAVVLIFAILFTAIYFVSNSIITANFLELEETETLRHLRRVVSTFQNVEAELIRSTNEYSSWSETKEFAAGTNQEYRDGNLTFGNAEYLDVNLMLVYDADGNPISETNFDLRSGKSSTLPHDLDILLNPGALLISHPNPDSQYSGFLKIDDRLVMFVSKPILDSYDNGPVAGSLIFARTFDTKRVRALGRQLESNIAFLPINSPTLPEDALKALSEIDGTNPYVLNIVSEEKIQGYALVRDVFNQPIFLIQLTEKREVFQRGQQVLRLLWGVLFVAGFVISCGLFVLLETLMTQRLGRLNEEVGLIWTQGSNLQYVTEDSNDEIASLSQSINAMLKRLRENREENRELEIALHQASEATRLKSEFLSLISHELRTPMNAIIGYTEIMLEDVRTTFDLEEAKEMLDHIDYSSRHLLALINEILDISKIESGHFQLDERVFNLRGLLQNLEHQMSVLIAAKDLEFSIEIEPNVPRFLIGDENRLNQILINLLGNGIKFTSSGYVKLNVGWFESNLKLAVQDSGIGISENAQEFIFMKFRQADSSLNREHEGSGLGLAIVKQLVEAHDGSICVQSQPGVGSTFTVELPFVLAQPEFDYGKAI